MKRPVSSLARMLLIVAGALAVCAGSTWAQAQAAPEPAPDAQVDPDAAAANDVPPARFDSPRSTLFSFLESMGAISEGESELWPQAIAALDLSEADFAEDSSEARQAARDLWGVLLRLREPDPEALPDAVALAERPARRYRYFPRPLSGDWQLVDEIDYNNQHIDLHRVPDGTWRFTPETVAEMASLFEAIKDRDLRIEANEAGVVVEPFLRQFFPRQLKQGKIVGLEYWQWIVLLVLILLGLVIDQVLRWFARPILRQFISKYLAERVHDAERPARPLGLLGTSGLWLLVVPLIGLEGEAEMILIAAVQVFAIFSLVWAVWRLADLAAEFFAVKAETTDTRFDDVLIPLIRKTIKIFIVVFGIVYAADSLNIPIGPMIASLGIAGVAFGFAAKDTVENFFGSVAVLLDRPFDIGDWVVIDDTEGTVEEVGFRSTRIRTFYNSQVTVPNSNLVRATVDNYGRRKYRRWKTHIGVQYDTPPAKLIAFTEGIRELVRTHPYTRKDYYQVWMHQWSASSMDVLLYIFFEVPDWNTELRERERMFVDIVRLADQLGVQFAFPTQTVHLFKEEHGPHETRHEAPGQTADRRAMVEGIRAAQNITTSQPWQKEKPGPVVYGQTGPTHIPLDDAGNPLDSDNDSKADSI